MARRGGRGATGRGTRGRGADAADSGVWALGDYEMADNGRVTASWEQDDWEEPAAPPTRSPGGMRSGLNVGVAGNPELGEGHPSGPLPPVSGRRARPGPDDYPTGGFPADDYPTGGMQARDYPTGGLPADDHTTGTYRGQSYDTGAFAADAYGDGDYETDGYPDDGYEGDGYEQDGYEDSVGYAEDYEAEGGDGWYEDAGEGQDWAEEDDEAFLPGVTSVRAARAGGQPRAGGRGGTGSAKSKSKAKSKAGRGKRRAGKWIALTVLVLFLGVGGAGFYYVWNTYLHPPDYSGSGSGSVEVHIANGDTATTVGELLQQDGVVASARAFHNAAVANPKSSTLAPGDYRLHKHMQASLALAMLLSPLSQVVDKVTIPEGYRLAQIIARLGQATHNLSGYEAAAKDTGALGLPSYANGHLEGYLFPDTYEVLPGESPVKVLREMVAESKQQVASAGLAKAAAHLQVSPHDLIVVASIVQAEGKRPQDMAKIARVLYNRLYIAHMKLECDSTVYYAMSLKGIYLHTELTNAQANSFKSPYNTYRRLGLPPGPIDSPGIDAINAALHPATGDWTYFITLKSGLTKFTTSYNQMLAWEQLP